MRKNCDVTITILLLKTIILGKKQVDKMRHWLYNRARKRENKVRGYGFLLISGCITMLIAIVFYILFYVEYL